MKPSLFWREAGSIADDAGADDDQRDAIIDMAAAAVDRCLTHFDRIDREAVRASDLFTTAGKGGRAGKFVQLATHAESIERILDDLSPRVLHLLLTGEPALHRAWIEQHGPKVRQSIEAGNARERLEAQGCSDMEAAARFYRDTMRDRLVSLTRWSHVAAFDVTDRRHARRLWSADMIRELATGWREALGVVPEPRGQFLRLAKLALEAAGEDLSDKAARDRVKTALV